jgi:hypothetical protein
LRESRNCAERESHRLGRFKASQENAGQAAAATHSTAVPALSVGTAVPPTSFPASSSNERSHMITTPAHAAGRTMDRKEMPCIPRPIVPGTATMHSQIFELTAGAPGRHSSKVLRASKALSLVDAVGADVDAFMCLSAAETSPFGDQTPHMEELRATAIGGPARTTGVLLVLRT